MKLLVFLGILQLISAEYLSNLPCPERPIHQDFDIQKLSGRWYSIMQYEDSYSFNFTCGYSDYQKIDDNSLKVIHCELRNLKYSCITGILSAEIDDASLMEGKTSYAQFDDPSKKLAHFKYLSIEYDSYAIVYGCKDQPNGSSIHALWVASRTPIMSETTQGTVNRFIDKYFDRNELKVVNQDVNVCGPRE